MSFCLSNILIKGRPLWGYLNPTIVLKGGQGYEMTKDLALNKPGSEDYYVFGSSHAYRGYDPKHFEEQGIKIFNSGSSGQSINSSFTLMKYYRKKFNRVILDIFPQTFAVSSDEANLILLQSTPDFWLAKEIFLLKLDIFSLNNFLYRVLRLKDTPLYLEKDYQGKGYVKSLEELPRGRVPAPETKFDEDKFKTLLEIITYCKEEGIDLTLVSHPLPLPDEEYNEYWVFKSRIRKISDSLDVPYYDYTYVLNLDNTYFKDLNHLNAKGVDIFNRKFINDKFKGK